MIGRRRRKTNVEKLRMKEHIEKRTAEYRTRNYLSRIDAKATIYATTAKPAICGIPQLIATCAANIEDRTDAQPLTDHAYAR